MEIEKLAVNAIRALTIDATNKAKSGHPGMAIGSAPLIYTLFSKHLRVNPKDPLWLNRDRFVLSAGHASMLLYAILHLTGYEVSLEDLKNFRQIDSKTPGHPEYGLTPGVDATTGPLGQGLAQAVGMAVGEAHLRSIYQNKDLMDHYTYVLVGDGCLQEGISQEAISFAGHQKLNKLIVVYDSNDVTLDGPLGQSFSEDVAKRFLASEWNVIHVADGNNVNDLDKALKKAKKSLNKPTLIIMKTVIGYGSQKQGTYKVHGNPLGEEDGLATKAFYGWKELPFVIPEEVYAHYQDGIKKNGLKAYRKWKKALNDLKTQDLSMYKRYNAGITGDYSVYLNNLKLEFPSNYIDSTRNTSFQILTKANETLPHLFGGSCDVAKSVMTEIKNETFFNYNNLRGRNINFGIREFGAASMNNGLTLHRGLKPYVGTFLAFADYMKPALRLAALSHIPSLFLFSHDSVALGEDGPTHQPIDQLAMMRAIPNFHVFRPADAKETLGAYQIALSSSSTPSAIVLTRQGVPLLEGSQVDLVQRGAYILSLEHQGHLDGILIATGSEVSLAVKTQKILFEKGYNVRVVSMPSIDLFLKQPLAYQQSIIGLKKKINVSIEALSTFGWNKFADNNIGIDEFGRSAPGQVVLDYFGFNPEKVAEKVIKMLSLDSK